MSMRPAAAVGVVVMVTALGLTGCATKIRNIPNQPLNRQPPTVAERDQRECERAITGTLKGKGVWFPAEVEFASCMIARDYQVYMQVLDASVEVRKASLRAKMPQSRIVKDLVTCERTVSRNVTWTEKIVRPMVTVAGIFFWPASLGGMAASATVAVNRQRDYTDCMKPLGYAVTPWVPAPNGHIKNGTADTASP